MRTYFGARRSLVNCQGCHRCCGQDMTRLEEERQDLHDDVGLELCGKKMELFCDCWDDALGTEFW